MISVALAALIAGLGWLAASAAPPDKKAAAPRLDVYFASDFTDTAYQQAAFKKVLAAWKPKGPAPAKGGKTVVITTIARDGKLLDAYFNAKSGSDPWDAAAIDAVKSAAPFGRLPASYLRATAEVHWHFEMGS
jgi:outer membrane biosynthesis protein TonB